MARGFTLLQLIVAMTILTVATGLGIVIVPQFWLRSRCFNGNDHGAGGALGQLVTHESVWRTQDTDKNGVADYWVRDVAAFHAMRDANNKAIQFIDLAFGRADQAPAFAYPELGGIASTKQGYFFRTMVSDQYGQPYLAGGGPAATARPARGICTNTSGFGFVAFPGVYESDGTFIYMVNEDGVVWQKDLGRVAPVPLDRGSAAPPGADTTWTQFGG